MNFLSLFVLIPILTMGGLFLSKNLQQIRVAVATGASLLLALAVGLVFAYLGERGAGNTAEMLFTASTVWYAPLNIHYSVGVDGISVAMLLLSAVIVQPEKLPPNVTDRLHGYIRVMENGLPAKRVFLVV